jgi:hypothetical protein
MNIPIEAATEGTSVPEASPRVNSASEGRKTSASILGSSATGPASRSLSTPPAKGRKPLFRR